MKEMLDNMVSKLMSRKLMVWLTATGLMVYANLSSSDWVAISLVYLGSQGLADIAKAWKQG